MEDPKAVAQNMIAIRGVAETIVRCEKYISGAIRSENPKVFWSEVKAIAEATR
jgi:hypothetical protein